MIKEETILSSETIKVHTVKTVLQDFQQTLNSADAKIYSLLYQKHALDKGVLFSQKDELKTVLANLKLEIILERQEIFQTCSKKIDVVKGLNCHLTCHKI